MAGSTETERRPILGATRLLHPRLVGIVLFLGGWQLLSTYFPQNQLPGLGRLFENVVLVLTGDGLFDPVENIWITLQRTFLGFAISITVGTTIGIFMGTNQFLEDYLTTPVMTFLAFPSIVWAFLGILWFGLTTYLVPVFVIVMIVTPYVIVNVWEGTKDLEGELVEMAEAFEAGAAQVWRDIYLPHLTPYLLSTTRLAFSLSWKILLVAEIFGTQSGVGHIVNHYYLNFRADMIIAWALPIMALMFGLERLLRRLETRLFAWRPETRTHEEAAA